MVLSTWKRVSCSSPLLFPTLSFSQPSNLALDSYHFHLTLTTSFFFITLSSLCHFLFLFFRATSVPQLQPPEVSILSIPHGFLQQLHIFPTLNNTTWFTTPLMQKHIFSVPLNQDCVPAWLSYLSANEERELFLKLLLF